MKNAPIKKHPLRLIAMALAISAGLAAPTLASHKTNAPDYDFAVRGANYPGWPSLSRCESDRPGQGCRVVTTDCGPTGNSIYTTAAIFSALSNAANEGQNINVHLVSATGHFINELCTLGN